MSAAAQIDFSKYEDQPAAASASSGQVDFSKYEDQPAAKKADAPKPTILSNLGLTEGPDVPISDYPHATMNGIQSVGRGVRGAVEGLGHMIAHPIDTAESVGELPGQVAQVPGAIHDINKSDDPTGTYAKVAQDTAGQGAGQAILALGTEGLAKAVPKIASAAKPVVRAGLRTAADIVDPDVTGIASPRLAHVQRLAGRFADKMAPKPVYPGASLPEAPPVYPGATLPEHPGDFPGAPLPEHPGTFPGAHLPEDPGEFPGAPLPKTPPREVLQARPIGQGGRSAPEASDALGKLPVAKGEPAPPPARIATSSTAADSSPSKLRGVKTKMGDLLNEGLGGKPLRANIPLKDQIQSAITRQSLPDGFTPADSSAIAGYKYDPAAREFEVITNDGSRHVYGDVSPDQAESFDAASSKGTAWKELRDSSSAKVAKIVNGKRVATKPPKDLRSATPLDEAPRVPESDDDLRGLLKKSVARAKSGKTKQ